MLDLKEEQKYEQLKTLGQELHIPIFEAFLELEVRNKDGKLIQEHKQRSHSWVRNAFNMLLSQMAGKNMEHTTFGAGLLSIRDTAGVIVGAATGVRISGAVNHEEPNWGSFRAIAASNIQGIVVGTGTLAESFEHFNLQTLIPEGIAAGQLNYVAMAAPARTYIAATRVWDVTWERFMNNNSGGSVSVNEVGLITRGSVGGATYLFMMARDLLPAAVVVPNTGQLRVSYTIRLTYPA